MGVVGATEAGDTRPVRVPGPEAEPGQGGLVTQWRRSRRSRRSGTTAAWPLTARPITARSITAWCTVPVLLVVTVALLAGAAGAGAASMTPPSSPPSPGADPDALVVHDPRLHPSVAGVQVTVGAVSALGAEYRRATAELEALGAALAGVEADQAAAEVRRIEVTAEVARAGTEVAVWSGRETRLRDDVRRLAVHTYVHGTGADERGADLDPVAAARDVRRQALVRTVSVTTQREARHATVSLDEARRRVASGRDELSSLARTTTELAEARSRLDPARSDAARDAEAARVALAEWRLGADVAGTSIPLVVLDAYVEAAATMAVERPDCGLQWWGLAGIGEVESRHATWGATRPGPDGVPLRPIVGIPLDGTNGTAYIADSDGGLLDGDPVLDRAVGPMQFIPGTWRTTGRDGNGDGRADPHNVYDGALAAGLLLCRAAGSGLDTPEGLRRGALRYNASRVYADTVVRVAFGYAEQADQIVPSAAGSPSPTPTDHGPTPVIATLGAGDPTQGSAAVIDTAAPTP